MPPAATLDLPQSVHSPSRARAFVRAVLVEWRCFDAEEVTVLLTSEVVTNAVVHAATNVRIEVSLDEGREIVHVEVRDGSDEVVVLDDPPAESQRGRGLVLVDVLASRWGSRAVEGGKVVWFDVAVDHDGAARARARSGAGRG